MNKRDPFMATLATGRKGPRLSREIHLKIWRIRIDQWARSERLSRIASHMIVSGVSCLLVILITR